MAKLPSPFPLPLSRKWQEDGHSGVDWARVAGASLGAAIRASGPGVVTFDEFLSSRSGYVTTVTYDNGVVAMYCHRQAGSGLKKGTRVSEGTVIAYVGYTGNVIPSGSAGAHLHLEAYVNGRLVNPGLYFDFNRVVRQGSPAGPGPGPSPIIPAPTNPIQEDQMYIAVVTHGAIQGSFLVTAQGSSQPTALGLGGNAGHSGFPVVSITNFSDAFWKTVRLV